MQFEGFFKKPVVHPALAKKKVQMLPKLSTGNPKGFTKKYVYKYV